MTTSFRLIAIYAEAEMRSLARRYVADCIVTALNLEPTRPWFLVKTKTDADRDLLTGNEALLRELKAVFRARECCATTSNSAGNIACEAATTVAPDCPGIPQSLADTSQPLGSTQSREHKVCSMPTATRIQSYKKRRERPSHLCDTANQLAPGRPR